MIESFNYSSVLFKTYRKKEDILINDSKQNLNMLSYRPQVHNLKSQCSLQECLFNRDMSAMKWL